METAIPAPGGPPGTAPGIYLVDDDLEVREWAETLLADLGLPIHSFATGKNFLSSVAPGTIGSVLLDLGLPDIHGFEVLEAIQRSGSHLRVVVLTGSNQVSDAVRAMRSGATDFLQKPPSSHAVRAAIKAAIAASARAADDAIERASAAARLARLDEPHGTALRLSVQGLAVKAIAGRMRVGLRTAERYRSEALRAVGARTILDAAELYRKAGG